MRREEPYQNPLFEKIAPFVDDYLLAELKIQQLKAKGFKDNKHIDKLENAKNDAYIEIYNLCQKQNQ